MKKNLQTWTLFLAFTLSSCIAEKNYYEEPTSSREDGFLILELI